MMEQCPYKLLDQARRELCRTVRDAIRLPCRRRTVQALSDGQEGKFFVWTPEEVDALLGPEDARPSGPTLT